MRVTQPRRLEADRDRAGAGPLEGVQVVVTRPKHQSGKLIESLQDAAAKVIELPVIAIEDPASWRRVDEAIGKLRAGRYQWVVFTSANGVDRFFSRLSQASLDSSIFASVKLAVVGSATAGVLRRHGLRPALVPERYTTEELARALGEGSGTVLLPRVENPPPAMVDILQSYGWKTDQVPAYRTAPGIPESPELERVRAGRFDVVTFTSSSTVRSFVEVVEVPGAVGLGPGGPPGRKVACIGPVTARTASQLGFRVDAVASEYTDAGLVAAIKSLFRGTE